MEILPQLIRVEPSVSSIPVVNEAPLERSFAQYLADTELPKQALQDKTPLSESLEKVALAHPVDEQTSETSGGYIPVKQENPTEAKVPDDPTPSISDSTRAPLPELEQDIDTDALAHIMAGMKHLSAEEVQELKSSLELQHTANLNNGESQDESIEAVKEVIVHEESPNRKLELSEKRTGHQENKIGDDLARSAKKSEKKSDVLHDVEGGDKEKTMASGRGSDNGAHSSTNKADSVRMADTAAIAARTTDGKKTEEAPQKDGEHSKKVGGEPTLGSDASENPSETAQAVSSVREAGNVGRRNEETRSPQSGVREITVELRQDGAPQEVTPGNDGTATPASFREAAPPANAVPLEQLARRLNGDLGESVVRQAQILMSEGDKAEIRLIIRPPELGRVRIQLQMEQGHIAGRILVDNANVRQVVEQNLAALQRAFAEAGLEMGQLDVRSGNSQEHAGQQQNANNSRSNGRKVAQLEQSVRTVSELDYGHRHINLVA